MSTMQAQNKWGGSFLAMLFALTIIGAASFTYYRGHTQNTGNLLPASSNLKDWRLVSNTVGTSQIASPSEVLSQNLYASYVSLTKDGEFTKTERDAMLADLAVRTATNPAIVPNILLTDLNTSATASLETYKKLFAVIISGSSGVQEYELTTFAKTTGAQNVSGTPQLQSDATIYKKIAAALLVMEVPNDVASEHLEVVKSIGALAKAVENMSRWKGDPIEALAEVDTFNKAEGYVGGSMNTLLIKIATLEKKS